DGAYELWVEQNSNRVRDYALAWWDVKGTPAPGDSIPPGHAGTEGSPATVQVASIIDTGCPGPYSYVINWGDGSSPTTGTISGSGTLAINGTHTWADDGTYTVTTVVTDRSSTTTITTEVYVAEAALSLTSQNLTGSSWTQLSGVTLATFTDANPL